MPDTEPLKQALVDACLSLVQAGQGAAEAAMATAGLVTQEQFAQLAPGLAYPSRNLNDASALAGQANQTLQAAYSCVQALDELEQRFPPPPDPGPTPTPDPTPTP
jgi:hypothetical protein